MSGGLRVMHADLRLKYEAAVRQRDELVALLEGGTYECSWRSQQQSADECPGIAKGHGPCWNHRRMATLARIKGTP